MRESIFASILLSILILSLNLSLVSAASGAIWTTRENCKIPRNENSYDVGDSIYIRGENFAPGEYDWDITGQPGQASCDPRTVVASGSYTVDDSGEFCFDAYTVADDDCKVYQATFGKKHDNYHVIPEFGLVTGLLTALSAVTVFFLVRRK